MAKTMLGEDDSKPGAFAREIEHERRLIAKKFNNSSAGKTSAQLNFTRTFFRWLFEVRY